MPHLGEAISLRPPPALALNAPAVFFFDSGTHIEDKPPMPKKPGTNPKGEFAFFNVVYEDGSQRSNRRVPTELLGGLNGDEPAHGYILEQDREIAEKMGPPAASHQEHQPGRREKEISCVRARLVRCRSSSSS